jgi:uncharacterized cupin superfamily protein
MHKVNVKDIAPEDRASPKGKFGRSGTHLSVALGRKPHSTDLLERHPFDVEIMRVPAGKAVCPYHSHSEQWEFYHVISGRGTVRHEGGTTPIEPGDAFIFKPGEPHQVFSDAREDLVLYVVADNPLSESVYYVDSGKWGVRSPEWRLIRSEDLDYYDGEE